MNTRLIGNIVNYKAESRVITPLGILDYTHIEPAAIIKGYQMLQKSNADSQDYKDYSKYARYIVGELIKQRKIRTHLGLGFAIISEGVLSVSSWGGKFPSVVNPHLFTFDGELGTQTKLNLEIMSESGAYCAWEGEIVGHESRAWQRYLRSSQSSEDKNVYLNDFLKGKTSDAVYGVSLLEKSLLDMHLSVRARKCLEGEHIHTLGDIIQRTEGELFQISSLGEGTLEEIKIKAHESGLRLSGYLDKQSRLEAMRKKYVTG